MTNDEKLMQQALDAIEQFCEYQAMLQPIEIRDALRARLAQPEPMPVAYMDREGRLFNNTTHPEKNIPLYTAPPQREWQGLTDEEIRRGEHHKVDGAYDYSFKQGAQWAEAKLLEKNYD